MPAPHHDPELLKKLGKRTDKSPQALRELASRKAGDLGISSPAALLLWAKEKGVSITRALNKQLPEVREEVRSAQRAQTVRQPVGGAKAVPIRPKREKTDGIPVRVIDSIIKDKTLRDRCKKMLQGKKHFDQVFREATTVLDDRLKAKTGIMKMRPRDLVGKAVSPDPQKAIIEVSSDRDEQEGFHALCQGTMLFFRNRAHHALSDTFSRAEALEFCGFVDTLLSVIEQGELHLDRV